MRNNKGWKGKFASDLSIILRHRYTCTTICHRVYDTVRNHTTRTKFVRFTQAKTEQTHRLCAKPRPKAGKNNIIVSGSKTGCIGHHALHVDWPISIDNISYHTYINQWEVTSVASILEFHSYTVVPYCSALYDTV